jgi:aminopeptidase N
VALAGALAVGCTFGIAPASTAAAVPLPPAPKPGPGTLRPPDPYFPALGNSGYDVTHYDLRITVFVAQRLILGDARITARATSRLRSFHLDLTGLYVGAVFIGGDQARFHRTGNELVVHPHRTIRKGDRFTVHVAYTGRPGTGTIPGIFAPNGWFESPAGITTLDEPDGASRWFPANDHPSDKATFTFRITVPNPLVAVANGTLRSHVRRHAITTWTWDEPEPMAPYLAVLAVGHLHVVKMPPVDGVAIRNVYATDTQARAAAAAATIPDMLRFFSARFGPYPFRTYGMLVPDAGIQGIAFESQTLSTFSPDLFRAGDIAGSVLSHELAHQWFGDWVSVATWRDIWLNEGFATYGQWLWSAHALTRSMADSVDRARRLMADEPLAAADDPGRDNMFGPVAYERGALTLHALNVELGDTMFFRVLRTYLARYGGRSASTADFIQVASDVAGRDLGPFVRSWLGPGPLPAEIGAPPR